MEIDFFNEGMCVINTHVKQRCDCFFDNGEEWVTVRGANN
jgi:hypothetical protein